MKTKGAARHLRLKEKETMVKTIPGTSRVIQLKKKSLPSFFQIYIYFKRHQGKICLVAQTVKTFPVMQETWDRSLVWEDPLEKGTVTHSSILAWRFPWTEETCR